MQKRYVVSMEFYMWEKDDSIAIEKAKKIAKEIDDKEDNRCEIIEIVEQPQGTLGNRKVYKK